MSFFQPRFCGVTVRDFKVALGWGSQTSSLSVSMVRDHAAGDAPNPPPVGWPCYFQFYGLNFGGLLQKWEEVDSTEGLPTYEAVVVDPREILEGAQLILGDYSGPVGGISNLLNVYGWWENDVGFGASESSGSSMPWGKVMAGLLALCNTPAFGAYGGPLNYRGVAYGLDLSQLPVPPSFYRITGPSIGLLDAIQQVCDDAAVDFFVELSGYTIRIRTVNRNGQEPNGAISRFVSSAVLSGGVTRGQFGVEARNETTTAFLVGGPKTDVHVTDAVASFWGYDLAGNPVTGRPYTHPDYGACEQMDLSAAGVADILGGTSYRTNTVEIRCALKGQEAWGAYVKQYRPDVEPLIHSLFGTGPAQGQLVGPAKVPADVIDARPDAVRRATSEEFQARTARLYGWLHGIAESYYGKQFLVQIPFVLTKKDGETNVITYSQEPTDAGYLPQGAASLGLSPLNQDILQDNDERVLPFAHWASVTGADTGRVNWSDAAVENNKMYARASVSNRVVFTGGALSVPCVVLTLGSTLFEEELDVYGGAGNPINERIVNPDAPQNGGMAALDKKGIFGTLGAMGLHPPARYPTAVGVPLKSNIAVYGPWFVAGAPGKVRFESDQSLTPWEYGGYSAMNNAGAARVQSAVTNNQLQESGSVNVVGAPNWNLGDVVSAGGPNLTNLDVQFGTSGVTTEYRFQTFTPRLGLFSRQNAERMKKMALAQVEQRRNVRKALNRAMASATTVAEARRGAVANRPRYAKKQSPHTVLMAEAFTDDGWARVGASTETYEAALFLSDPTGEDFTNKAVMSWTGLVRPFTTQTSATGVLPHYTSPGVSGGNAAAITRVSLDPFQAGHDVDILTSRETYQDINTALNPADPATTRAIALRGPLVVAGWGPGTDGRFYPDGSSSSGYETDARKKSQDWKVGPVDLLWDNRRGVWTSHDLVTATLPSGTVLSTNGSGTCRVGGDAGWPLTVFNYFSSSISGASAGTKIIAGYCVNANKWYVVAADCVS